MRSPYVVPSDHGAVCGVGAGGHPKRAQSWALSSHLAGMPLLTTRCSHHVVDPGWFGLALPVFAIADKGGWALTNHLVHLQQCIGPFVPEVSVVGRYTYKDL
jgi:hypothetical protein